MARSAADAAEGPCAVYISGNIGDSVLHLGFMRALAQQLGRPLILLNPLPPAVNRLFEAQPYIDKVVGIGDIECDPDKRARRRRMAQLLRSLGLHTLFFFNFKTYAALAALSARVPRRVGFVRRHQFHNALLFTHSVLVQKRGTPHPDTHTWLPRLLARHGYTAEALYPSLFDSAAVQAQAAQLAQDHPRLIALGLGASVAARRYPAALCAELIGRLRAADPGYSFVLFGAADVADLAAEIQRLCAGPARLLDITGMDLDLRVGSALMARCLGCVSNDSLALHLAVAHRVPTVGLFGISPPMHYVPWLRPLQADSPGGMSGISSARIAGALMEQMAAFPRQADQPG
ncbi:MAG: glycosyltransferase family 9 protein [Nevskia sp.]|nr:glycosyltransferase family 9 protein [Nevskia sp.]